MANNTNPIDNNKPRVRKIVTSRKIADKAHTMTNTLQPLDISINQSHVILTLLKLKSDLTPLKKTLTLTLPSAK